MRITVASKLAISFGLLILIILTSGSIVFIQLGVIESKLNDIVNRATPISDAAYEMEINLIGTGFGLLGYLEDRDPEHLNRIREDIAEFQAFHQIHKDLAETIESKDFSVQIGAQFDQFNHLANSIVLLENEQDSKVTTLYSNLAVMDDLLDEKIQAAISPGSPGAYKKLEAAMELEINTNGIAKGLGEYLRTFDSRYEARVMKDESDFKHFLRQYLSSPLTQEEESWVKELDGLFAESAALTREIIEINKHIVIQRSEFVQLRRKMDALLDEGIQEMTRETLVKADLDASQSISTTRISAMFFLIGGVLIGIIASVYISRNIAASIRKLATTARSISSGNLQARVKVTSNDEIGELLTTFNEMAFNLSTANKALETQKEELEKLVLQRTSELEESTISLERAVQERTDELQVSKMGLEDKVEELEDFYDATIEREVKMEEMRKRIEELEGMYRR